MEAGVVEQHAEDLGDGPARDAYVVRHLARIALQASALAGEQPVPPLLGLPQQPREFAPLQRCSPPATILTDAVETTSE
ncbi:hypothetical protein STRTUCAR8_10277 [Streptomyces turgidiscabies Car8]|uniref:Uncharacterized protein n=1 Tax=Streptomyces turgidiscabies (strain Car8) TaxID=698760 RepID=L7F5D2_STRT8|nr:hypothetical protein STRTUCAR8_10277 [Streptomyces turgidiscabies Car8]